MDIGIIPMVSACDMPRFKSVLVGVSVLMVSACDMPRFKFRIGRGVGADGIRMYAQIQIPYW